MAVAVLEPVRERFSEAVATMSPRDRRLLTGLAAFVTAALLGGGFWIGHKALSDVRSRIDDREHTLSLVQGLASDQEEAATQVKAIEDELRRNAGQDLPSIAEKVAGKVGISANLQAVREKEVATQGNLEERKYTATVSKVSLQQLTDFLYELETGGYPLKVRSMKTKTVTVSGVKMLNADLELSAFKILDGEGEAAPAAPEEKKP